MYLDDSSALIQTDVTTSIHEKEDIFVTSSPVRLMAGTRPRVETTSLPSNSPIFHLPHEILQYIFTLCLPTPSKLPASHSLSPRCGAPLVLTQICSSFRSLALSTPELWVDVTLRAPQDVARAEKWLERTGSYRALNVTYNLSLEDPFDISKISNRIRTFDVWLDEEQLHHLLLLAELSLDSLTDLSITVPKPASYSDFYPVLPHITTLGTLASFPAWSHLHRLSLNLPLVLSPSLSYLTDLFPWSQLTYLSISSLHYSIVTPLLSFCTSLREARIELYTPNAMVAEIESPVLEVCDHVVLEHLHSLSIISDHFLRLNILDGLFVPKLRSLGLVLKRHEDSDVEVAPREWKPWAHTRSGYEHFFSQLRGLKTFKISQNIPARRMLEILGYMPELKDLEVAMYREAEVDDVLEGLTLREREVVPKLEDLDFTLPSGILEDTTITKMKKLATSRSGILKKVGVGRYGQRDGAQVEGFRGAAEGMDRINM